MKRTEQQNSYGSVIREYRKRAGMDQISLSAALGYSKNTVSNWENGIARPDIDAVKGICELLGIPLGVFFGIPSKGKLSESERKLITVTRKMTQESRDVLMTTAEALLSADQIRSRATTIREFRPIRYVEGAAAAGFTVPMEDKPDTRTLYIRKNDHYANADAIYGVNGESMLPKYEDGCRVYVEDTDTLRPGEDGVFIVNNELFIKRFEPDGLHSYNPDYPTMRFTEDDTVRVMGRVLGTLREEDIASEEQRRILSEDRG